MRRTIWYILIDLLIIQNIFGISGCTSFYSSENSLSLSDYQRYKQNILITLNNSNKIIVAPGQLYYVDNKYEVSYGIGIKADYKNKTTQNFSGIINMDEVDSNKIVVSESQLYHLFWLKDKTRLRFEQNAIYHNLPDSGGGYWLAYDKTNKIFNKFYERDVSSIEVEGLNWPVTLITIASIGLVIAGIILAVWGANLEIF